MFEQVLSDQQLASHEFLRDLIEQHKLHHFGLTERVLVTPKPLLSCQKAEAETLEFSPTKPSKKLLMFAEGLCLQQILQVSHALKARLEFQFYSVIQVSGVQGFAISAIVKAHTQEILTPELENLAQQFCIELCLVDKAPSLAEPGLLLMDMDSTVIAVECIDEIAAAAGVGQEVAEVTAQAMQGKLDFAQSLTTRVACLAEADQSILEQVKHALPLMPGVANLVTVLKQHNWKVAIASGGFSYFADYLQGRLALDAAKANDLQIEQGKLTGQVVGPIVDAQAKAQNLLELAQKWQIPSSQTIAMGDGANDLLMMNAAALGVALHAKPIVRQQADIAIRWASLDALLWVLAA
ncbi:phosphoserine phosphatase SerB [Paraglaciecola aestuariivivens]